MQQFPKDLSVSVIIPAYNCQQSLNKSVQSVMKQTYPISEVVVVDDCSTPPLKVIHHKSIKLIRNDKNKGAAFSRNRGVAHATGEFIAFLDADDQWFSEKISHQIRHLEKVNKRLIRKMQSCIVLCGAEVIKFGSTATKIPRDFQDMKYLMSGNWFFSGSTLLMPRALFIQIGGFDPNLSRLEDYDFFIRLKKIGAEFTIAEKPLCLVDRNPHARVPDVTTSAMKIVKKNWLNARGFNLKRCMLAYLCLEIGATAFYARSFVICFIALFLSFLIAPRVRIQMQHWWN